MKTLDDIKEQAKQLVKYIDNFVVEAQEVVSVQDAAYRKKMKEIAVLKEREKKVKDAEEGMAKERALLEKEKANLRERNKSIEIEEKKLEEKAEKIQRVLGE
jgi:hypothetical protein